MALTLCLFGKPAIHLPWTSTRYYWPQPLRDARSVVFYAGEWAAVLTRCVHIGTIHRDVLQWVGAAGHTLFSMQCMR